MIVQVLDPSIYPLFVAAGVTLGLVTSVVRAIKYGVATGPACVVACLQTVAALAGAKVYSLVERGDLHWGIVPNVWSNAFWQSGYRAPGGILAMLVLAPVVARVARGASLWTLGDIAAPAIGVAFVVIRVGCLVTGCCFGELTHLPWAVRFGRGSAAFMLHLDRGLLDPSAPASLPVHPLQVYFLLMSLAVTVLVLWLERGRRRPGEIALLFLLCHELGKALLETFRAPVFDRSGAGLQVTSFAIAAVSGILLWCRRPMPLQARPGLARV